MKRKSRAGHKICVAALSILGLPVAALGAHEPTKITVEGFVLQDMNISVYGGPMNHIRASVYGTVKDSETSQALEGIKIAVYDGTRVLAEAHTQDDGTFYIDEMSVWADVGLSYTVIISDPQGRYAAEKQEIKFKRNEVSKKLLFSLSKK